MVFAMLCTAAPLPTRAQAKEVVNSSYLVAGQKFVTTRGEGSLSYAEIMARADQYATTRPYDLPEEEWANYLAYKMFTFSDERLDVKAWNLSHTDLMKYIVEALNVTGWWPGYEDIKTIEDGRGIVSEARMVHRLDRAEEMKAEEKRVLALVDGVSSAVAKALVIHDFVCKETQYVGNAERTMFNVALNKTAQCEGYSRLYAYYMNLAGIPCEYVSGDSREGFHAWNRVYLNNQWYLVDTTWDDLGGKATGKDYGAYHTFFLRSGDQFSGHTVEADDQARCNDARYANAFWTKANSVYSACGDYIVYPDRLSGGNILRAHRLGTDAITEPGKTINVNLTDWRDDSSQPVDKNYCTPVAYGGKIYYNTPTTVYSWNPNGGSMTNRETVFTVTSSSNPAHIPTNQRIFSLEVRDGALFIGTAKNSADWDSRWQCNLYTYTIDPGNPYVKPVRAISTAYDALQMTVGEQAQLEYASAGAVTITSGNPAVCTVQDGTVTAVAAGTTTLVLTTEDTMEYQGDSKIITVTVETNRGTDISRGLVAVNAPDGGWPARYTGIPLCPTVKVSYPVSYYFVILDPKDYEVTYANNTEAGTADITVTAKAGSGYTGTLTTHFPIINDNPAAIDISGASVRMDKTQYEYTGEPIQPAVTLLMNGTTVPPSGYTVSYENDVGPGTATVTLTGTGGYTGSVSATYTIAASPAEQTDLTGGSIAVPQHQYTYTGEAICPSVTVKDRNGIQIPDTGYDVQYYNNTSPGTATIVVTGKAPYTGTVTASFKIVNNGIGSYNPTGKGGDTIISIFETKVNTGNLSVDVPLYLTLAVVAGTGTNGAGATLFAPDNYYIKNTSDNNSANSYPIGITGVHIDSIGGGWKLAKFDPDDNRTLGAGTHGVSDKIMSLSFSGTTWVWSKGEEDVPDAPPRWIGGTTADFYFPEVEEGKSFSINTHLYDMDGNAGADANLFSDASDQVFHPIPPATALAIKITGGVNSTYEIRDTNIGVPAVPQFRVTYIVSALDKDTLKPIGAPYAGNVYGPYPFYALLERAYVGAADCVQP